MRSGKNRKNLFEISVDYVCAIFGIEGSIFIQINKLPSILYTRKIALDSDFSCIYAKKSLPLQRNCVVGTFRPITLLKRLELLKLLELLYIWQHKKKPSRN
jgi:hypothetical protein